MTIGDNFAFGSRYLVLASNSHESEFPLWEVLNGGYDLFAEDAIEALKQAIGEPGQYRLARVVDTIGGDVQDFRYAVQPAWLEVAHAG